VTEICSFRVSGIREFGGGRPNSWSDEVLELQDRDVIQAVDQRGQVVEI
jgi:hypothetical protein